MPNSGWNRGGSYLPSAVQARAFGWVGQVRRPAGFLWPREAAKALGVHDRTLRRLVEAGQISNYRGPEGDVLYREADVLDLAAHRMVKRGLRAQKAAGIPVVEVRR